MQSRRNQIEKMCTTKGTRSGRSAIQKEPEPKEEQYSEEVQSKRNSEELQFKRNNIQKKRTTEGVNQKRITTKSATKKHNLK